MSTQEERLLTVRELCRGLGEQGFIFSDILNNLSMLFKIINEEA